ncbi:nuclear transport factor 2 family protein [Ahrensia kielensis]|uniref:Nuclear transport factor 2 family protein n=1 Tax=Ahrensia kielensis TaxID=76980 RepID=A0ABU9TAM9_9HYPH
MKLLSLITLAASLSIAPMSALANDHQTSVVTELHAFNDRFNKLAASGDAAGLTALYAEDSLWIAPGESPISGRTGAKATFGFMSSQNGQNVHSVEHLYISEDGTMAVMIGDAEILVESAGMDFTGTYQFVLRHDGSNWKIISDMYTVPKEEDE